MQKPIIFLDIDGVVNTGISRDFSGEIDYCIPHNFSKQLNNKYAFGLLNILYEIVPYDIVVSSAWRHCVDCRQLLYDNGLNPDIEIIDCTHISFISEDIRRGFEIYTWIKTNNFNGNFIILDDKTNMANLVDWLVLCDHSIGFDLPEFEKAKDMLTNENYTLKKLKQFDYVA